GGLLQLVHHPLAPDARLHGEPAAGDRLLRQGSPRARDGDRGSLAEPPRARGCRKKAPGGGEMVIAGPSKTPGRLMNSMIIGFGSTFLAVFLGTLAAYAFSRFNIRLKDDLMFFILSTRFMPPIAVAIPVYLMYRQLGMTDTHLGMILLYTAVNVSLAVWLLK